MGSSVGFQLCLSNNVQSSYVYVIFQSYEAHGLHWWVKQTYLSAVTWQALWNCWYVIQERCWMYSTGVLELVSTKRPVDLLTNHVDLSCRKPLSMVASVHRRSQEKLDLYVGHLFSQHLTLNAHSFGGEIYVIIPPEMSRGPTRRKKVLRTISVSCSIVTSVLFRRISLRLFSQNLLGKGYSIALWLMMHLINSLTRMSLHTLESTLLITGPAADVLCH